MAGEFGKFIDDKRRGRSSTGGDILLKDIAQAMGVTATYLSDIVKGRRNPPDMETLQKIAAVLNMTDDEKAEMFDLAGRERNEAAPDLRRASDKKLGNEFWKKVYENIEGEGDNGKR